MSIKVLYFSISFIQNLTVCFLFQGFGKYGSYLARRSKVLIDTPSTSAASLLQISLSLAVPLKKVIDRTRSQEKRVTPSLLCFKQHVLFVNPTACRFTAYPKHIGKTVNTDCILFILCHGIYPLRLKWFPNYLFSTP